MHQAYRLVIHESANDSPSAAASSLIALADVRRAAASAGSQLADPLNPYNDSARRRSSIGSTLSVRLARRLRWRDRSGLPLSAQSLAVVISPGDRRSAPSTTRVADPCALLRPRTGSTPRISLSSTSPDVIRGVGRLPEVPMGACPPIVSNPHALATAGSYHAPSSAPLRIRTILSVHGAFAALCTSSDPSGRRHEVVPEDALSALCNLPPRPSWFFVIKVHDGPCRIARP